jgi:hypothetical protein
VLVLGLDEGIIGGLQSSGGRVKAGLSSRDVSLGRININLGVGNRSLSNSHSVLGSTKVGLGPVAHLQSTVELLLKFKLGCLGRVFLLAGKVQGKLSLSLISLPGLGKSLGASDHSEGISDGGIRGYLLRGNLVEVIDKSNISVRNVDDVIG